MSTSLSTGQGYHRHGIKITINIATFQSLAYHCIQSLLSFQTVLRTEHKWFQRTFLPLQFLQNVPSPPVQTAAAATHTALGCTDHWLGADHEKCKHTWPGRMWFFWSHLTSRIFAGLCICHRPLAVSSSTSDCLQTTQASKIRLVTDFLSWNVLDRYLAWQW